MLCQCALRLTVTRDFFTFIMHKRQYWQGCREDVLHTRIPRTVLSQGRLYCRLFQNKPCEMRRNAKRPAWCSKQCRCIFENWCHDRALFLDTRISCHVSGKSWMEYINTLRTIQIQVPAEIGTILRWRTRTAEIGRCIAGTPSALQFSGSSGYARHFFPLDFPLKKATHHC